jgi:hypothetical protein
VAIPIRQKLYKKLYAEAGGNIHRVLNESTQSVYRIPPSNDEPCNATLVPVAQTCLWVQDDNTGATQTTSLPIPSCDAPGNNDLWYKFVVPPSGYISFQSRAITLTDADLGLGIYTGGCANPIYYFCDKNSLPNADPLIQYMPSFTRLNLRAYIGQTVLLRLWEFGDGADFGTYEFCIVEDILPAINCDDTYLEILETVNISTPVQLGEDNLVTGQQKYIEWTIVANQDIPEGAVALYNGGEIIHKQAISVNAGEQFCVCPIISEVLSPGSVSGTSYTFKLVINPTSNNLNNVNAGSQLVCEETVFFYTPQITVDPLRDFIYDNGDQINFYVNKNIQEPIKLEVENTVTGASVDVNDALDFAEEIYFIELGYCVQDWIIPASLPEGSYELVATSTVDGSIIGRGAAFIIGGCIDPFISQFEEETVFATEYLYTPTRQRPRHASRSRSSAASNPAMPVGGRRSAMRGWRNRCWSSTVVTPRPTSNSTTGSPTPRRAACSRMTARSAPISGARRAERGAAGLSMRTGRSRGSSRASARVTPVSGGRGLIPCPRVRARVAGA